MYNLDKNMNEKDKIIKAKAILQKENPFFSYILSQMKFIELDENTNEFPEDAFIGVNPKGDIFYKKGSLENLKIKEIQGVLTHEALHVALKHLVRKLDKNAMIWNLATDIVVNNMLNNNGLILPEGGVIPNYNHIEIAEHRIEKINTKTAESVFNELLEIIPQIKKNSNNSNDKSNSKNDKDENNKGNGINNEKSTNYNIDDKKQFDKHISQSNSEYENNKDWNQVIMDAYTHSKMKGVNPQGFERIIDGLIKPKIPWRTLLQKYIRREIPVDWTYSKPNKKSIAVGTYLPDVLKESIELIATVDTSGSVDKRLLTQFVSEVVSIVKSNKNVDGTILFGDCDVGNVIPIKNGNINKLLNTDFEGGGGTSHIPFYEWIKENKPNVKLIINLTDGWTDFPEDDFSKRTNSIWVIPKEDNTEIPFGHLIEIER